MAPLACMPCSVPWVAGLAGRQPEVSLWAAQQWSSCRRHVSLVGMQSCLVSWPG